MCSKPPETQSERTWNELSHFFGWTDRTFQDIADAAEYARQLSLELNGSVVKVFDAETGLVIFTAKSRAKIED